MDYARLSARAQALLQKHGEAGVVTRVLPGAYDENTLKVTTSEQQVTVSCIEESRRYHIGENGRRVQTRVVWITGSEVLPGDRLNWDTLEWQVAETEPTAPAGTLIITKAKVVR